MVTDRQRFVQKNERKKKEGNPMVAFRKIQIGAR